MIVDVDAGVAILERGGVVAYPTETVYGLGADARSAAALGRLYDLKGRGRDRGVSLLVPDLAALEQLAPRLPERVRSLARSFWPGPLTLVFQVDVPELDGVRSARGIGFRCSSQPTALALARAAAGPIVSTSCNRSGALACRDAAMATETFGDGLAIVGGESAGGLEPSTVVAVDAAGRLELLREGALAFADILEQGAA